MSVQDQLTVFQLTDAATITPDLGAAGAGGGYKRAVLAVTLGGNRTIGNPVGASDGQLMQLRITQDATGGRTLTWGTAFNFGSAFSRPVPVLNPGPGVSQEMVFGFASRPGEWRLVSGPNLIPTGSVLVWPVAS